MIAARTYIYIYIYIYKHAEQDASVLIHGKREYLLIVTISVFIKIFVIIIRKQCAVS